MKKQHRNIAIIGIILIFVGAFFLARPSEPVATDELTGAWRAGGENAEGFEWYMIYTFDNGTYDLETGTDYAEAGTYTITETFEDGSRLVEKVFAEGTKTHEMAVRLDVNDPGALYVEGVRLEKVEE